MREVAPRALGRRRLERLEFEPVARRHLAEELAAIPMQIEATRAAIRGARAKLRAGVVATAPRRCQPLTSAHVKRTRSRIRNLNPEIASLEERRRIIETEPDPLVSWDLYRRVHGGGGSDRSKRSIA